jgi:hypothetical protein
VVLMSRRSYGSGQLFVWADRNGRETWYGSWRVGGRRIKRRIGLKRKPSTSEGLTRTQPEAALRGLMASVDVIAAGSRHTVAEAGELYITHLEVVMERKRSTIADHRDLRFTYGRERQAAEGGTQPHLRQAPGHHSGGCLLRRRVGRRGPGAGRVRAAGRIVLTKVDDLLDQHFGSLATGGQLRRGIRRCATSGSAARLGGDRRLPGA